ncbi:MAG: hypothetical protein AAGH79_13770, partial [Bacteroidota bacterium]
AKVYSKTLRLSELEGMIPDNMSTEDSTLIINAFIKRWVRDAVMMHEAEQNVDKSLNLEKLVEDYKSSLVLHNYEQLLVDQLLDSTVTQQELKSFYEKNKENYQLQEPLVRGRFIKVLETSPDMEKLDKWWDSDQPEDYRLMVTYCATFAVAQFLGDSTWNKLSTVRAEFPKGVLSENQLKGNQDIVTTDGEFKYYFRPIDWIPSKELAPFSYIADQAKKVILHKRKMQLLDETKETMYQQAMRRNEVKFYRD